MSAQKNKTLPALKYHDRDSDEEPENETRSMLDVSLGRMREGKHTEGGQVMESLKEYNVKIETKTEQMTLFDQIMAKSGNTEDEDVKKILLQRLVLVARLPNGLEDRTELAVHYEKLSLHLGKQFPWDNMTGLLLLYPSCLLHVVESSRDVLVTILEDLIELQQTSDCVLLEAPTILFIAHNPHSRQFQQWSYKLLNAEADLDVGPKDTEEEPTEMLVIQVLSSVEATAKQLEQAKRTEGSTVLKVLGISPELLVSLTAKDDLQTPQQYLKSYNSPLHISMNFGQVKRSSCLNTV